MHPIDSRFKDTHKFKLREWKKIFMQIETKRAGVTILISHKILGVKKKKVTRNKDDKSI